jgi:hypothetical protein
MFLVSNIMKLEQMYLKLIEKVFVRKDVFSTDTVVASLLLVVSATLLACVIVNYAINIVENTLQMTDIPEIDRIREIQEYLYNQTDSIINQTMPELSDPLPP